MPTSLLSQAQAKSATNTATGSLLPSSDAAMVGMLMGSSVKWSGTSLTYSFPSTMPSDYSGESSYSTNWSALNSTEQTAVRAVFTKLAELIPVSFTETSGTGDLRFSVVDQNGSAGFAVTPAENRPFGSGVEGDVFLATTNRTSSSTSNFQPKDNGFATVLHEVGHAMGLKHPFETPLVPQGTDNHDYTIMSYTEARNMKATFTKSGNSANVSYDWLAMPASYALYDIAALQTLYGANTQTRTGSSTYTVSSRNYDYLCIWDAGGTDWIDAASATGQCVVNLNPGTFSTIDLWSLDQQKTETIAQLGQGFSSWVGTAYDNYASQLYTGQNNLSIAYGSVVENVMTGSGADTVTDNAYNNSIQCGAGNDTVYLGKGGFDSIDGGAGLDTIMLSTVTKSQVQLELQSDSSLLLLGPTFAATLVGIESVVCSDGAMTLPA